MTGAALMLALASGCVTQGVRETKDASTPAAASAAAADVRRVQVSGAGAEPAVATGEDGSAYVAWVAHGQKSEADVWLARFEREGRPGGAAVRVNPAAGVATAWRGDPPDVAVAPDGTVYVAWTARDEGAEHATTLYLSASRDGWRSFDAPVRVNDDTRACVHGMHSLTAGADGRVYLAWLDERDLAPPAGGEKMEMHGEQNREVFFAASSDGGRTFGRNRRVATEACPCCDTSLAVSRDGRVYVGWRQVLPGNFRHIAVASSEDGGETFNSPTVVSDDRWELRGCPVSGPALAAGEGGALRVLWYTAGEAGQPGLYRAESNDGGRTFGPRHVVEEGTLRGTPALLADASGHPFALFEGVGDAGSNGLWRVALDGAAATQASPVAGGESASAASRAGHLNVAYVAQGGIWLAQSDLSD